MELSLNNIKMKKYIILNTFSIAIIILYIGCQPIKNISDKNNSLYEILKMDTVTYKHDNIFYLKRNDSIFKTVSKKEIIQPCEPLALKKKYEMELQSMFPDNILNRLDFGGRRMYGEETILFEKDSGVIWDLFISPNIKGTCYTNSKNKN